MNKKSSPKSIYSLLVGIDEYLSPIAPLRGCVNDIKYIEQLLQSHSEENNVSLYSKTLLNSQATRNHLIESFRQHLSRASEGDVALFYYSGHGSQQKSPPEFWHLEPDRLDETLVCWDSRTSGTWDLADKELSQLIAEVAANQVHVVVILDCCHSGSGSRDASASSIRRVSTDLRERPVSSFICDPRAVRTRATRSDNEVVRIDLPSGRHILMAACRSDEEAKEYALEGEPRGVFSYFLYQTLTQSGRALTYREVFKRINALVRSHAALQSPQLEPSHADLADEWFLGGGRIPGSISYLKP